MLSPTIDICTESTPQRFVLCIEWLYVFIEPKSGFKIAFNMFDTDGNQRVDKKEFLVLMEIYNSKFGKQSVQETASVKNSGSLNLWGIMGSPSSDASPETPLTETTLTVHFFGRRGNDVLKYEDFHRFMDNLQTEVLELEYNEFSKGMATITEVEFAQILLRYTILSGEENEEYLQRLRNKVEHVKGITFKEFKDFCQFLNNLDDFALAMRLYAYAHHDISQDEFNRAVKACTGYGLSDHLVDVVFKLFDVDNDRRLSQEEFISVMKDRLHRGFRHYSLHQNGWELFKSCVKNEMRTK